MHQTIESGFTSRHNMIPTICSGGMRALTCEEIEQVSGGLPFALAPLAIGAAKVFGVSFVGAIGGAAGMSAYNYFTEDYEACSM
ncbi:MAG: hypothetical protein Q8L60_05680 [Gammaproteobacteria bacterium]|nr:hypothetical protein [Gammaproteobacteria bacterium]MDP2348328.1 hypothetical protein [Gammaproteobacteria bacterium]